MGPAGEARRCRLRRLSAATGMTSSTAARGAARRVDVATRSWHMESPHALQEDQVHLRDRRRGQLARQGARLRVASARCSRTAGSNITLLKLDPYINVDPGTMSPFQHGEVFVTDDGAETDLDLGHYERFTTAQHDAGSTTSPPAASTTRSSRRSGAASTSARRCR